MEVHYESLTVVETEVHYPTDVNLLWDALRCLLRVLGMACPELGVGGWRQSAYLTEQERKLFNRVRSAPRRRGQKGRRGLPPPAAGEEYYPVRDWDSLSGSLSQI